LGLKVFLHHFFLDRRLGGPQSQSGHGGKDKNSQLLPGLETPIIQLIDYNTELPCSSSTVPIP